MSSGWLTMLSYGIRIRSLIWWLSHPDDLAGVGISSGWLTVNSLCHPDDIPFHLMSSGWLNWAWYLIRMSYGSVIMSSGWDTLPVLSHPDEIANFDFPHHAVALQRFRIIWRSRVRASPNIICMICNRLIDCAVSRPDDIAIGNISSGWLMVNVLCHPDDITYVESYVIRMR